MGLIYEYLTYDGVSSLDFGVKISGSGTFDAPVRDIESISIPGRNGDLHIDNGRFNNIDITYPAYITEHFSKNFDAFKAFLLSKRGYKRLVDTYHPDHYRLAIFNNALTPDMTPRNLAGSFDLVFNCDPRRFLMTGDKPIEVTTGASIKNPTLFDAKPLIRVYGTGTITVGGISVVVNSANVYTDLDSELEEAYKGTTNCNGNITLTNGQFIKLAPGLNTITFSNFSKVEITPRWWTV